MKSVSFFFFFKDVIACLFADRNDPIGRGKYDDIGKNKVLKKTKGKWETMLQWKNWPLVEVKTIYPS